MSKPAVSSAMGITGCAARSVSQEWNPGRASPVMKTVGISATDETNPAIVSLHFGVVMTTLAPQSFTI